MTKVQELEDAVEDICKQLKQYQDHGVTKLQQQLHEIDEQWQDGAVKEADGSIAAGQAQLSDLMNEAHEMIADLLESLPEEEDDD